MNIVLSAFSSKAYKEFILPNINNTNYSVTLNKEIYQIANDIILNFDVIEHNWRILSAEGYSLVSGGDEYENIDLKQGVKFDVVSSNGASIRVSVSQSTVNCFETKKYTINKKTITVGSGNDNDIVCKASFISHTHAKICYQNDEWSVEDLSQNGVFVNSVRVRVSTALHYGDVINIIGLKIIFLSNILALCEQENISVSINSKALIPASIDFKEDSSDAPIGAIKKKEFFNRAPRILRELHTEPFEIEPPPTPKPEQEKSLLSTLGPSFTMAIPMMMGSFLMIYSSKSSGGSTSPLMFTGMITAITSAMLGVFWGIVNYRRNEKKGFAEEKHRFEAYSEYLMKVAEKIKNLSRHNYEVLHEIYPAADEVVHYTRKNNELWNRNFSHDDFLTHRVGIGDVPFQSEIMIPKEKFTLIDDSLAGKPAFIKDTYSTLKNVPVCLDLLNNKLVGIVGGEDKKGAYRVMKNLSAQIAASNCYTDVKLAYIFRDNSNQSAVSFSKWLPHCWSEDKKTRYCAFDYEDASDICYELTKIFRMRDENSKESYGNKDAIVKPYYILFVEDISLLDGEPLAKYVFDCKDCYGLTTVLFANNYEDLPNACKCIVFNDGIYTGVYTPTTLSSLGNLVTYDSVNDDEIDSFARTLSKIEVSEVVSGGDIPNSLTFLDMYHVSRVEELNVIERWKKNRTYENMRSLIGQKAGGTDCFLDIHEKYHGPHGLVAGTTGSGKSETLQTYILSLAINYSPDDVGFLLVDFKGGGMANLFTDLPHTLGQISNLSGAQIRRAMISIKSENLRRQRLLSENGVNNINAYTRLLKNNEATVPLPHLFIIIDEFAELKREEPEFMAELISVAQVGRSLGVHLILATQKPGGVVDDNIRSNSKFKLCLRVQDKQDSSEMLGKPDAAYLSQAGRCYLQVGNDEIFELFQSGWSGATYDETEGSTGQGLVKLISSTGKTTMLGNKTAQKFKENIKVRWLSSFSDCVMASVKECGAELDKLEYDYVTLNRVVEKVFYLLEQMEIDFPMNSFNEKTTKSFINLLAKCGNDMHKIVEEARKKNIVLPEPKEKTQLDAVIDHLGDVAAENNYHKGAALWLPMLPENLYIDRLSDFSENAFANSGEWKKKKTWSLAVPIGMCDDPENQAQVPLTIDFAESGHLAVCGNITSGKSTFLQTLFYSLTNLYSPEELNIYAIDFSNHMLQAFEDYPHTGAIMYENDLEKIDKFFYMMGQMLLERKKAVGGGNFGQFINANGNVFSSVVVAIDNYSNFREKTDDKYEKILWELSRDGASFGIFLAISAGGFGSVEIQNKIGENIRNVVTLDLGDKMKYSEVLRVIHLDIVPTTGIKGRGITPYGDTLLEYQTALSCEAEDDYSRSEIIKETGVKMAQAYHGTPSRKVPEIPEKPTWSDLLVNSQFISAVGNKELVPFAYDKETASIYSINLRETYCYLIQGKSRTGRSDLMKLLIACTMKKGAEVTVFETDGGQLSHYAEKMGVSYMSTPKEIYDFCSDFTTEFKRRNALKRSMLDEGVEETDIFDRMKNEKPMFIFVSDFASFIKTIYTNQPDCGLMNGFFENIIEKGRLHNIYFIFDLNMDDYTSLIGKKVFALVTGYKNGVQLGGLPGQKVFDISGIHFSEQNKTYRPGVGFAFDVDGCSKIIIPSSKGI